MSKRGSKLSFIGVACPNESCKDYGKIGKGNVVGNGTYQPQNCLFHKYICRTCSVNFSSRSNTIFLKTCEETIIQALKMILKGMGLLKTAEIMGVKPDTVRRWIDRDAKHSEEVNKVLMKDIEVDKVKLDELRTYR